jgi:hypothetical protein
VGTTVAFVASCPCTTVVSVATNSTKKSDRRLRLDSVTFIVLCIVNSDNRNNLAIFVVL